MNLAEQTLPPAARLDLTVADATERLMSEFEDRLNVATISRVVCVARRDLQTTADGSLPELVERLARQRLLDQLAVPTPRTRS